MTRRIEGAVDGDAGSLIAGFVTGDDSGLSDRTRKAFELTNTSHITAVSGSNIAVLLSMWLLILPSRRLRRSPVALIFILLAVWSYVLLVGMGPGAVRAGLFATSLLPAPLVGRKGDPLTALMTVSAVMLLVEPQYSQNVGFWLSMAASASMVTTLRFTQTGQPGILMQSAIALVAAQFATLPITFLVFDGWSPGSLVANLLIGPLVSLLFPIAFISALLLTSVPWAGDMLGWIPALGANLVISIVESIAGEFSMVRPGPVSPSGIALIAVLSASVIAGLSADVQRWVLRLEYRRESLPSMVPAIMLGASLGLWVTVVAFSMWW